MRATAVILVGAVLAVAAWDLSALSWFDQPLAPPAVQQEGAPVAKQPDAVVSTVSIQPAGEPAGVVRTKQVLAELGAGLNTRPSWPSWCASAPAAPWTMSATGPEGQHISVALTAAGQGRATWQELKNQLQSCEDFELTRLEDNALTLTRYDVPTSWTLARSADVIVSVHEEGTYPRRLAEDLVKGIAQDCKDTSGGNPNYPGYQPYREEVVLNLAQPVLKRTEQPEPQVTWRPPPRLAVSALAPVLDPTATVNRFTYQIPPTGPAPVLMDPMAFTPPSEGRPESLEEPSKVKAGPKKTPVLVPAVDVFGPGCGWAFTGTLPPEQDADQVQEQATARLTSYELEAASKSADWFVKSLQQEYDSEQYAKQQLAAANWRAYDQAMSQAKQEWSLAQSQRQASEDRWFSWTVPTPEPLAPPTMEPALPTPEPSQLEPTPQPDPTLIEEPARP